MCGIAGIYRLDHRTVDKKILKRMNRVLHHRGPDNAGEIIVRNIGLANSRLAVIDPTTAGNQPMGTGDGKFWITYNGEIFNYREIRDDLIKKGIKFVTKSDTEVILLGYRYYGINIIKLLKGQFAFCIYDLEKDTFILARDQIGINPLFYSLQDKLFLFASEVKSILASHLVRKDLDKQAIHHYLSMFTIPAPFTIFSQIKSLLPGHYLVLDKNGLKIFKYYELPLHNKGEYSHMNETETIKALQTSLIQSVQKAKIADVPVGVFLSGGIDSSTIVALMSRETSKRLKTFSLWTKGDPYFDERKYAKIVAEQFQTDHTEVSITDAEMLSEFPKYLYYIDQPAGGALETYFISKTAGKSVKVALSGLGGDELFSGYHSEIYRSHFPSLFYRIVPEVFKKETMKLIAKSGLSPNLKKTILTADKVLNLPSAVKKYLYLYFAYLDEEKNGLYNPDYLSGSKLTGTENYFQGLIRKYPDLTDIEKLAYLDLSTYTRDDLLLSTNMASMANSLEVRVPFLYPDLIEFAFKIRPEYKYHHSISKYILKKAVSPWLPKEVLNHKKTGFAIPRAKYMHGVLKKPILQVLSSRSIARRGIFDPVCVSRVVSAFYYDTAGKALWKEHLRVWSLFIFEMWCRLYLDRSEVNVPQMTLAELSEI